MNAFNLLDNNEYFSFIFEVYLKASSFLVILHDPG